MPNGFFVAKNPLSFLITKLVSDYEWEILRLTNIERAEAGLSLLSMSQKLQEAGDVRLKDILTVFSHTRPDGNDALTAIDPTFRFTQGCENIIEGENSPEKCMETISVHTERLMKKLQKSTFR